jgi:hypothetical protein
MKRYAAPVLGLSVLCLGAGVCHAQTYSLAITPDSGLAADIGFDVDTAGTLIGDWTADANPTGTRTKPGLFGSFGSTENLPVAIALGVALAGRIETVTAGSLELTLDIPNSLVSVDNLVADLLASGPAAIPATISLAPESFRTRQPDSVYIGIPIDLPIGELAITTLTITQTAQAVGVLTEIEPGRYSFAVIGAAEIAGTVEVLGSPTDLPPTPTALTLAGEITVVGSTATLTSLQSIDLSETQNPGVEIPEFPVDLPTILPPGETAHTLMNLVLEQVATSFVGDLRLNATGEAAGCVGDFNGDGAVNTLDVLAYLNAWAAGDPSADINGDGSVNTLDVLAFLNAWAQGC